jgi:transposase
LAQLFRASELTSIYVPTPEDEAFRDLFEFESRSVTYQEYRHSIFETIERIARYDQEIESIVSQDRYAHIVKALQSLRGIALITAATIASEIGTIARFAHPSQFMSYCGLVPRERSSGGSRWQGGITKVGNAHLRRIVVESAWSYRHVPAVRDKMKKRLEGLSPTVQSISWKA